MPKSKTRRRDGRPVQMRRPGGDHAAMVYQRQLVTLIEDLDRIVAEVPISYDAGKIGECVEHHYRCEAVVRFLRARDVAGVLAHLAGGELVVVPDSAGDILPVREPGAAVDESGQTVGEALGNGQGPDVWIATKRRGIPYHAIDHTRPDSTVCNRDTRRGAILPHGQAEALDAIACALCYRGQS